ncbi:MAG: hypothetical protein KBF96_00085 [Ignavibacteria bacterium]|nr:hypothetical protein [Ignavibacteria bacterium]
MKRIILFLLFIIITYGNVHSQSDQGKSGESKFTFKGNIFGDFFLKAGGDSTGNNLQYSPYVKDFNAFAFRRVNFGVNYKFNRNFDSWFSLSYDGPDTLPDGNIGVLVKDAFVRWTNVLPRTNMLLGIMPTPAYSFTSERWWSYRSVEKTIMDQRGIVSSRDFGFMVSGVFDEQSDFGYYAMIGNGSGNKIEQNKYKKVYATLFGNFLEKNLLASFYTDYSSSGGNKSKTTLNNFVGYKNDFISIGIENFFQINSNFNTSATAESSDIVPYGLSVFISQNIISDELNYFLRYDYFNQDINNSNTGFYQSFMTAGLDITPAPDVHIMPNIWLNAFTPKPLQNAKYTTDVVPRITFWYEYK